jgi:hypothetical protein
MPRCKEKPYFSQRMEKSEMRQIAEEIARDSDNGAARIAALRFLRDLEQHGLHEAERTDAFAELDEFAPRRGRRR